MKSRYRTKVSVEGNVEETQFIPVADSSPRIKTRYVRDPEEHGKYKDGREYSIDPERVEDEAEEAEAEAQIEQSEEQIKAMREQEGRAMRKRAPRKSTGGDG